MDYHLLKKNSVFVEIGSFDSFGGWVLDTQFIQNMGSAYLLAHGIGQPVENARTIVCFPEPGEYRLFAYTRDWVASWKQGVAPGLFKVLADGSESAVLGNENVEWHWQQAGSFAISGTEAAVELQDLTGFEGRCAALFFTKDANFAPPENGAELESFRRVLCGNEDVHFAGQYDFVVAGGGFSGMCAALAAARKGLKTALLQDRDMVGGNNSSEVRVWLGGEINLAPFAKAGDLVREFHCAKEAHYGPENTAEIYEDENKLAVLRAEPNLNLYMGYALKAAHMDGDRICGVTAMDVRSGRHVRIDGDYFADCTGDATMGAAAGADFEMSTNSHLGMTNHWQIHDMGEKQSFPRCPFAIDLSDCDFPGRNRCQSTYGQERGEAFGGWYWESGFEHDPIEKAEYIRDTNLRAMYGAWDCVKNVDNDYANYKIGFSAYIAGKRESRRLCGDIFLNKSDVQSGRKFDDGIIPTTWSLDLHYPDRKFYPAFHEGDGFLAKDYHEQFDKPYLVPYRILYSRNIGNLFMAGRNASVSHEALGTIRVMRTCGMMGEVIGTAAALCKKHSASPRGIYSMHLAELLDSFR